MTNPMIHVATTSGSVALIAVNRIEAVVPVGDTSEITTYGGTLSIVVQHPFHELQKMIEKASIIGAET